MRKIENSSPAQRVSLWAKDFFSWAVKILLNYKSFIPSLTGSLSGIICEHPAICKGYPHLHEVSLLGVQFEIPDFTWQMWKLKSPVEESI